MTEFIKVLMVNGVKTYLNSDAIIHIDSLKDHLAVHLTDDTIMNVDKNCLKNFLTLKK